MRAAPAFRERLSDFEAASTGSFSDPSASGDLGPRRPGKAQPPPGEIKDTVPDILPDGAALARAYGV